MNKAIRLERLRLALNDFKDTKNPNKEDTWRLHDEWAALNQPFGSFTEWLQYEIVEQGGYSFSTGRNSTETAPTEESEPTLTQTFKELGALFTKEDLDRLQDVIDDKL